VQNYVYLYFGGKPPATPKAGQARMQQWMAYFAKLGDRNGEGGAPIGETRVVGKGRRTNPSGLSIVRAESLDEAVALTKGHPHLKAGGTIEVCALMPIPG
jgi:hypothetical protein